LGVWWRRNKVEINLKMVESICFISYFFYSSFFYFSLIKLYISFYFSPIFTFFLFISLLFLSSTSISFHLTTILNLIIMVIFNSRGRYLSIPWIVLCNILDWRPDPQVPFSFRLAINLPTSLFNVVIYL